VTQKSCSVCGKLLNCGLEKPATQCWCARFPPILPLESDKDCQCPDCLALSIGRRIEQVIDTNTLAQSLEMAAKFRDSSNIIENIDYTMEQGNLVFSAWYHLKRGVCCGNGCRNCPYGE